MTQDTHTGNLVQRWRDAIPSSSLEPTSRLVAYTLASFMRGTTGECHPALATVAVAAGLTPRSVGTHVTKLELAGWLKVDRREGRSQTHTFTAVLPVTTNVIPSSEDNYERDSENDVPSYDRNSEPDAANSEPDDRNSEAGSHEPVENPRVQPEEKKSTRAARAPKTYPAEVLDLCAYLGTAIARHRDSESPKVTDAWRSDMDLLVRRGPTDWAEPKPIEPDRVRRAIDVTFSTLAIRKRGFCWADQIRSPGALRERWETLKLAARGDTTNAGPTLEDTYADMDALLNGTPQPALTGGTQ